MRNRIYYALKPYLPDRVRMGLRRALARHVRATRGDIWPILESAGRPPAGWPGWPEGRRFAFVLSHDVESSKGLARVRALAQLEMDAGVRSSFNFVPEGEYRVPAELRQWLLDRGFEVGVHDLHHDGRLFVSHHEFQRRAARINKYLAEWGAVGFRSAFMLRRLDWIQDLDVMYDASTFDTDPFEPEPQGMHTVFPFWIDGRDGRNGFVELPYTLPQDSTLFNLLDEPDASIWCRKLDWIARCGGMAFVNVHPDYVALDPGQEAARYEFPAARYREYLDHLKTNYLDAAWLALPREVAEFVRRTKSGPGVAVPEAASPPAAGRKAAPESGAKTIWIDLDNTPHVPFFLPIIRELERRGHRVVLSARDAFQVIELADRSGMRYTRIGRHYGKHLVMKILGMLWRSAQLLPFALRHRPDLALSHGARSQIFLANLLRIPTVLIGDYEHAKAPPGCNPLWKIVPQAIFDHGDPHARRGSLLAYPGLKEDVYSPDFRPDPGLYSELGISVTDLIATVRPPANEAHYRNPESDVLFVEVMRHLLAEPSVRIILLPRNRSQGEALRASFPHWFADGRTLIPAQAVDGLNLIWHSDLVVSGGGTMNREAAALGVPVYSIFRGKTGAVDRQLEDSGRLVMVRSALEVASKIRIHRREKRPPRAGERPPALASIVAHIEAALPSKQ